VSTPKWSGFALKTPKELADAGEAVSSGLATVTTALQALRVQARLLTALAQDPTKLSVTAANLALKALLAAVRGVLNSLLDETGVYMLMVPLPKKGLAALLSAPPPEDSTNQVRFPTGGILGSVRSSRVYRQLFNPESLFIGGNAHYFKTVAESLYDKGDLNRPTFLRDEQWAYCAVVAGAEDVGSALTLIQALDRIFGPDPRNPGDRGAGRIIPSGFTGRLSPRGYRPTLQWNPVNVTRVLENLGNATITVTRYMIVSATEWQFTNTANLDAVFTGTLAEGLTGRYGAKILAIKAYDGLVGQWTGDEEIPAGESRYYTVVFETRFNANPLAETDEESRNLGFNEYATPVEIARPATGQRSGTVDSKRPDWQRSPSLATLIPPINQVVDRVLTYITAIERGAQSFNDMNDQYLAFLNKQIDRFESKSRELTQIIEQLARLAEASRALGGAHVRIAQGRGSAQTMLSDLLESFEGDETLPIAFRPPPYVVGTEFTCGVFLLGLGPDVQAFIDLFNSLFGDDETDPIVAGIRSIPMLLNAVEQSALAALQPLPVQNPENATSEGFDANMTPRADNTDASCDPTRAVTPPTFDSRLNPIT
jgi:hypothetical protein